MDENLETVKEDVFVKSETSDNNPSDKKPLIKDLFSQLSYSINELTFTTSKAIELAQKFSDTLEEKEVSEQICSPLKSAFESFGASSKAIQFAGNKDNWIKERIRISISLYFQSIFRLISFSRRYSQLKIHSLLHVLTIL